VSGNPYCMGIDAGGSTLRIASGTRTEDLRVTSNPAPSNLTTLGIDLFVRSVSRSVLEHIGTGVMPHLIALGIAGLNPSIGSALRKELEGALTSPGSRLEVAVRSDAEIAFAVVGAHGTGTILIAGTGALAGSIQEGVEVRSIDGNGSLLGDFGGGYWIGIQAARCALRDFEILGERSTFLQSLLTHLQCDRENPRWDLIRGIQSLSTSEIAAFAPLVFAAAGEGDRRSIEVIGQAADYLSGSALAA
jgi:glucosamine kinase